MQKVLAIILGGGRGTRLYPLTKLRAKPAVPLAGKYRLIDIPVSNCLNSGLHKIYVLTQFNSASLNRHISRTFQFSPFSEGFVEILAAQQTPERSDWFQGTADAVRQYLPSLRELNIDEFLVLSGDHLYKMDYRPIIQYHREQDADVTVSVIPVSELHAPDFGILKTDSSGNIIEFKEKPKGADLLQMKVDEAIVRDYQLLTPYLANMGIYVFKKQALIRLLTDRLDQTDFSKEVIPSSIGVYKIKSFMFKGYWEDIGTIETFYHANMGLVKQPIPAFDFFDNEFPIFTRSRSLPPNLMVNSHINDSFICDGCKIFNSEINGSIIGIRSYLCNNVLINDSLLMGSDFYQSPAEREADLASGIPPVGIGENTQIRKAIIDKNARIGRDVRIVNSANVREAKEEARGYWISSGVTIIIKSAIIPDGTVI